jgi:hypothetical protein
LFLLNTLHGDSINSSGCSLKYILFRTENRNSNLGGKQYKFCILLLHVVLSYSNMATDFVSTFLRCQVMSACFFCMFLLQGYGSCPCQSVIMLHGYWQLSLSECYNAAGILAAVLVRVL